MIEFVIVGGPALLLISAALVPPAAVAAYGRHPLAELATMIYSKLTDTKSGRTAYLLFCDFDGRSPPRSQNNR
jgi:hypothetical protein